MRITLAIFTVVFAVFVIRGQIYMVRWSNTKDTERQWGAALRENEKLPPGLARAEDMVARLKAIKTGYAPDELKQAIADYIAALQGAIDAAKSGRDTTLYDDAMDRAKQRMIAAAKKYD